LFFNDSPPILTYNYNIFIRGGAGVLDEYFMRRALKLALRGAGKVSPNPMVGAVLVKDGKIIAEGYHEYYGGPHAEVVALDKAGDDAKGATLYVNLEPCSHFGKTPPCAPRIVSAGIKRVVISTLDPNPLVAGKGVKLLRESGVSVTVGVLEKEAKKLNEAFFKWITQKIPFVALKVATTLDGKIATLKGESKWITSLPSRRLVHKLRAFYDAVLVGIGTVLADDPELNVRLVKGRNPVRVILDAYLRIPENAKVLSSAGKVMVFHSQFASQEKLNRLRRLGVELIEVPLYEGNLLDLRSVLEKMGELGIASVLVEGGRGVFSSFIKRRLADKLFYFLAPKLIGKGIGPFDEVEVDSLDSSVKIKDLSLRRIGEDVLLEGYVI